MRAALQRAADQVTPPADLAGALRGRRRRRTRRRYQAALAFAGVVIVAAGGTVVLRGGGDGATATNPKKVAPTATPAASTRISDRPAVKKAQPARVAWPDAVSTVPAKAGDGARYMPLAALSPTEVVLLAQRTFEKTTRIDVYDTRTEQTRVLTRIPVNQGYLPQRFEVGTDYIGWYGMTLRDGNKVAHFWVAPRAGGPAIKVGEVTGTSVASNGVSADSFVWSAFPGGVYRIPITGGSPEKIAGTDGLWLASWPWATDLPPSSINTDMDRNQTRLVNLETGEKHDIVPPPGVKGLHCTFSWCAGRSGDDLIVMHPDGSGLSRVAGLSSYMIQVAGSHFIQTGGSLYDPVTGKTATIGTPREYRWAPTSSPTLVSWEDGHGRQGVLNMLAVDG
ncbi:hypothetical protein GCM10023194_13180 [Planotetraspora phitsanulokensis]|uniref:Uncharacterized protein n=1 Tax=Planotetraspora phitsanulokensis TaxID=575192 RepID=A0A8J3U9U9_9ACTN|nr:hypothetical protein Pph01_64160 [Planotetraspora phitsanulokensis]